MARVKLQGIEKAFGATPVLRGIDLVVEDGEFTVLVGASGCGKSTLLRVVAGLEDVDSGDVYIGDVRANDLPPAKRRIAMVFQSYALYPHMTVGENMGFGLRLAGRSRVEIEERVRAAASLLEIEPLLERRPRMLSGGQRQRVAIGRAIVREPSVFLFDEPLSNLDAELRVRMRYEFARLHQRLKTTTLYVTHDQVEAMTLADRIAILDQGEVVQFGPPDELYDRPATVFVAGFIGSPRMNFLHGRIGAASPGRARIVLNEGIELDAAVEIGNTPLGDEVTLGIRPEHLRPGGEGVPATVDLIESLGNVRFAYLSRDGGGDPLVVQLLAGVVLREGERVALSADASCCHLFDARGNAFARARLSDGAHSAAVM